MKRSTKSAPDCLSISYLIGSAFIGISMITLNSCGTCLPAVTSWMLIEILGLAGELRRRRYYNLKPGGFASIDGDRTRPAAGGERRAVGGGQCPGGGINGIDRNGTDGVDDIGQLARRIDLNVDRRNARSQWESR